MRDAPDRRYRSEIKRISRVLRERAHTALAEDHVVIAFSHNVFGCKQPLLEGCSHAALQKHRQLGTTGTLQKREVLHAAGTDLNYIAVFLNESDMRFLNRFGHDLQSELLANRRHNFPPSLAETLERVR